MNVAQHALPVRSGSVSQSLRAALIGNVLEWFDWTVYAAFSSYLAASLFAPGHPVAALLQTLGIFSVGFVARPLGGFLFGRFADKRGRKASLTLSMMMMATGSLLIAIIPSYESIGALAAVLLLAARLLQGLAHGGESAAAYVYVSELAPPQKRGLWSSSVFVSVSAGVILASLLGVALTGCLTQQQLHTWGWRLPFAMGAMVGCYAYFLRRSAVETSVFEKEQKYSSRNTADESSGKTNSWFVAIRLIVILGASNVVYAVWLTFATTYAISVQKISPADAFRASLGAQILGMLALPLFGTLSDRYGRKPMALLTCGGFVVLSFWLNTLLTSNPWMLFIAESIALVLWAALGSVWPALMAEQVATGHRAAIIGVVSSLGAAIFGGTAPYLNTYLASVGKSSLFLWYTVGLNVVAFMLILTMRETRGVSLETMTRQ